MKGPLAWKNGKFISQGEAVLPWNDAGIIFGATVTDLVRTFNHLPFRLVDHLERLFQSAEQSAIPISFEKGEIEKIAEELIQHNTRQLNKNQDLAVVFFATPGPIGYYFGPQEGRGDEEPLLAIHTFPLPVLRHQKWAREGVDLAIPTIFQVPPAIVSPGIKHRSRLHWWMAGREVKRKQQSAEALLCDGDGNLTETGFANVVLVKNPDKPLEKQAFLTPPRHDVLPGITLEVTKKFAQENRIKWEETQLSPKNIGPEDALLLTGTTFCFVHANSLNGQPLSFPDATFTALNQFWKTITGVDVRQQNLAPL